MAEIIEFSEYEIELDNEVEEYFINTLGRDYLEKTKKKWIISPKYQQIIIINRYSTIRLNLHADKTKTELISFFESEFDSLIMNISILESHIQERNNELISEGREPFKITNDERFEEVIHIQSSSSLPIPNWRELPKVIVDRFCGESVLRGSDLFLKGILCAEKTVLKSTKVSIFVNICENNGLLRGIDYSKYNGKALFIGTGISILSRDEIFRNTEGLAIKVNNRIYNDLPSLNSLPSQYFYVQNYPSIMVGNILNPKEDETILDMCCAPGGKTTHIGYLSNNKSTIIAIDKSKKKIENEVISFISNWNLTNIIPFHHDSTQLLNNNNNNNEIKEIKTTKTIETNTASNISSSSSLVSNSKRKKAIWEIEKRKRKSQKLIEEGKTPLEIPNLDSLLEEYKTKDTTEIKSKNKYLFPSQFLPSINEKVKQIILPIYENQNLKLNGFYSNSFDRILLDPPCSALGLRPRLLCDIKLNELKKYANTQRDLFKIAYELCKVDGIIVYSTCTINPMENEENVFHFLSSYKLELLEQEYYIGSNGYEGCSLKEEEKRKIQRFDPFDENDTIGFFISKFRKIG